MVEIYTNSATGVATPVDTAIQFESGKVQTGCSSTGRVPTSAVSLNKPGFYLVQFDAVLANNTAASGEVGVQMYRNGTAEPNARSFATSAAVADVVNVSFSAIVQVTPNFYNLNNNANLTFNVTGVDALVYQANVTVTRLP